MADQTRGTRPDIKAIPPNTDLLGRLQDFIPRLKEANEGLAVHPPEPSHAFEEPE